MLKSFDASNYFSHYNKTFPIHPKLTAEQASAKLGPKVNASGKPKLEIHKDKLVYAFPVTGIEGVSHVYVNARTGAGEGIDYNF
ncbi:PepSY domain-containing protein [Paenibacillus pabuli]